MWIHAIARTMAGIFGTVLTKGVHAPPVPACHQGRYFEAVCTGIDPVNKEVTACFPTADKTSCAESFKLHYDILVMGVSVGQASLGFRDVLCCAAFMQCSARLLLDQLQCLLGCLAL